MREEGPLEEQRGDCDAIIDLIPAYVIGALDPIEQTLVERLLPHCPEAQAELANYQPLGDALHFAVPQVAPPAALGMAIAQAIAQSSPAPMGRGALLQHPRWAWGATAAAIVVLLLTNLYWLSQWGALRADLSALQAQISTTSAPLRSLGADGLNRVDLISTTTDEANGRLSWVSGQNTNTWVAWFVGDKLPPIGQDAVYQLWLIRENAPPISAGFFRPGSDGQGALAFEINEPLSSFQTFGVTVEPAGGSATPTTDPILRGSF